MKKTVLITGVSRGIGKATAKKFLDNGWKVYGTYNKSLSNLEDLIKKYKSAFVPVGPYDFTELDETNKFIDEMLDVNFDAMFLNAGIFSENDDFINFNFDDFNSVMNCNFYSPLTTAIRLKNNINTNGSIILMSSNDSYSGAFASISYSASKGAIANVMKSLSVNFGKKGVRVNSIAPGAIDTDMNTPEQVNESPKWTPLSRVAQPYEVANVVYFLAGDESSFVNGENITIDGGYGNVSILLKMEMESNRVFGDYKTLVERYNKMKKGESIFSIDVIGNGSVWEDTAVEREYLNAVDSAEKRGVNVYRFIVMPESKQAEFKNSTLFKEYSPRFKNCYIFSSEFLKTKLNDVYRSMGNGFDVYVDKNGNKHAFIDFYASDNCVGVLTDSEIITNQLFEKIEKLKKVAIDKNVNGVVKN